MQDGVTIKEHEARKAPAGLSLSSGEAALRLTFLDGIRALAALYVVLSHHVLDVYDGLGWGLQRVVFGFQYGHYAVDVFIVLSGYCLMLPVARSGRDRLRGGTMEYLSARAMRILPPYFASLILSIVALAIVGKIGEVRIVDLLAHLLVIHNFSPHWVWSINPPLWSVAVEWQIYFAFPLLLLPLRKRVGSLATAGIAWAVGMTPHVFFPTRINLDWSYPWYLGLFAMGIWAAEKTYARRGENEAAMRRFAALSCLGAYAVVAVATMHGGWLYAHNYAIDFIMGWATASGLAWAGRSLLQSNSAPLAVRVLSSRWLVALGAMSFSLYLVHLPIWWLFDHFLARHLVMQPAVDLAFRILVGTPLSIAFGMLFYLGVEKPSMMLRSRAMLPKRPAAPVVTVDELRRDHGLVA
jgi:peptidoglycan/LPS O-acetylase OafA/YrhL